MHQMSCLNCSRSRCRFRPSVDPAGPVGVSEVDWLSCCAFVFVDEAAEDVAAVELLRCG
jgi:hypothetical protein